MKLKAARLKRRQQKLTKLEAKLERMRKKNSEEDASTLELQIKNLSPKQ